MATLRIVRLIPAASLLVVLGACALQSNGDDATSQSAAMEEEPRCDICCQKGGTWDNDKWLCCIPLKKGGTICTNAPETIKYELTPTPNPIPTTRSTVVTVLMP